MSRRVPRPHIIICGTRKLPGKKKFAKLVRELAHTAIRTTDWRIVTGGYGSLTEPLATVDELAVDGAKNGVAETGDSPQERILTLLPERRVGNKYFEYGTTMVMTDAAPKQRRAEMVQRADVIIAIGGGKGTADIVDQAYAADKPLLPLAFTGGAAAEAWKRYRPLLTKRYAFTPAEVELIEKGHLSRAASIESIIQIVSRMIKPRRISAPGRLEAKTTSRPKKTVRAAKRSPIAARPRDGKLRLVVASPGDVTKERAIVRKVVSEVNRDVCVDRGVELQVIMWETDTYPGFHAGGPQGIVDELLRIEDCDVLVGIFWKRFGSPTQNSKSGTEHEIRTATASWEVRKKPQMMLYFSTKPYAPKSAAETKQWTQVLEFRAEFETKGLLGSYTTHKQFEDDFRRHLSLHVRTKYRSA